MESEEDKMDRMVNELLSKERFDTTVNEFVQVVIAYALIQKTKHNVQLCLKMQKKLFKLLEYNTIFLKYMEGVNKMQKEN